MVESFKYDVADGQVPFGPSSLRGLTGVLDEVRARGVLLITDPAKAELAQEMKEMPGGRMATHYENITQHVSVPVSVAAMLDDAFHGRRPAAA